MKYVRQLSNGKVFKVEDENEVYIKVKEGVYEIISFQEYKNELDNQEETFTLRSAVGKQVQTTESRTLYIKDVPQNVFDNFVKRCRYEGFENVGEALRDLVVLYSKGANLILPGSSKKKAISTCADYIKDHSS